MRTIVRWAQPREHSKRSDLDTFRADTLRVILWLVPLGALAVIHAFVVDYAETPAALALLIPWLVALVVIAQRLIDRWLKLAALLIVCGLFVSLAAAVWLEPFHGLTALLCLVVLIGGATLGARAGYVSAALAVLLILVAWRLPPPLESDGIALESIFLAVMCALLCGAMINPVSLAIEWAWKSYDDAVATTAELRAQRAELGRVVKSLNEAYAHLERLNGELAWARQVAEEARRHKAEFAANISHELRTPLNLIIGFSEMITSEPDAYDGVPLPAVYRRDLAAILRNANHLSELIDDVLDLGQIEVGRMALIKEEFDVAQVIDEATDVVARLVTAKGLELRRAVAPNLPTLLGDRTRIRQVLINLLSNAARFTNAGSIGVSAESAEHDVIISVSDTGVGMASDDIPRVFERFRQAHDVDPARVGGSGLGLAVSKQIIELHGGSMWAESRLGEGTTFHFSLPVRATVIAAPTSGRSSTWERVMAGQLEDPPEVVVVSPDPGIAALFQRYLDHYQIAWCASAPEAARRSQEHPGARTARLVVSSSAAEAWTETERLHQGTEALPTFTCALKGRHDLARELGVAAYLVKPIGRDQLIAELRHLPTPPHQALIVDDDPDMARLVKRWIRATYPRCRVSTAANGEEALALLGKSRPDVVLLDILMPKLDGYAVLKSIHQDERLGDVPVIVITARGEQDEAVTAGVLGISQPGGLTVGQLMECLRASLDALLSSGSSGDRASAERHVGQPV